MLWADPQPWPGRGPNKRGVSICYGPDVTRKFLSDNGLQLLVRSHEVKDEGYLLEHGGKCITVFRCSTHYTTIHSALMHHRVQVQYSLHHHTLCTNASPCSGAVLTTPPYTLH
jgi:hypothetical protein